jgi:hypothetical protein
MRIGIYDRVRKSFLDLFFSFPKQNTNLELVVAKVRDKKQGERGFFPFLFFPIWGGYYSSGIFADLGCTSFFPMRLAWTCVSDQPSNIFTSYTRRT